MKNISEKNLLIFLIALVIIFGISSTAKWGAVSNLTNQVNILSNTVNGQSQKISDLYSQIESLLNKKASILDSYEISYGAVNSETMTYEVHLSVIPKEFKDSMTAEFTIGDLKGSMSRSGTIFSGTVNVPIAKESQPIITFYEDGLSRTETLSPTISFRQNYLYDIKANYTGNHSYSANSIIYDGNIIINYNSKNGFKTESCRIFATFNNKEILSKNVVIDSNKETTLPFKELFTIYNDDQFALFLEIKGSNSLTYRYVIHNITIKDGKPENYLFEQCIVYDKNGKEILFD